MKHQIVTADFPTAWTGPKRSPLRAAVFNTKDEKIARSLEYELRLANAKAQNQNRSQGTRSDLLSGNTTKLGDPAKRNTVAHVLRRLLRERPDLMARIESGEFSINAAAIEAGFRKRLTPLEQILALLPRLTAAELRALDKAIAEAKRVKLPRNFRGN